MSLKALARSSKAASEIQLAKADLLDAIARSERGLRKDGATRKQIMGPIEALRELSKESVTTGESLSATWKLLWTTEKETLFIFEKAPLFRTQAGDTFQPIDLAAGTLGNVITFPPSGAFLVKASVQVASSQRINFRCLLLLLRTPSSPPTRSRQSPWAPPGS
eukprot:jgi/Mesen1/7812/ME000413S07063